MLKPKTEIRINKPDEVITITYCIDITIENDWDLMTMTALITLPNEFQKRKGGELIEKIERGDEITVFLGYEPYMNPRFTGYVASIIPGSPYTLKCEGLMYKLKQKTLRSFSQNSVTLKQYVEALWSEAELGVQHDAIPYDVQDTSSLGKIEFKDGVFTASEILQNIRDPFKFVTFQYGSKLKIGYPYTIISEDERLEWDYYFNGQNGNIISENLEYQDINDVKIVIEGESINTRTNARTVKYAYYELDEIKVSDAVEQGNTFSLKFINISETELEESIKRELESRSYSGLKGDFTTFGIYPIRVGDIVNLKNYKHTIYDGKYYIKGYTETMSTGGYRQTVRLAKKVA